MREVLVRFSKPEGPVNFFYSAAPETLYRRLRQGLSQDYFHRLGWAFKVSMHRKRDGGLVNRSPGDPVEIGKSGCADYFIVVRANPPGK